MINAARETSELTLAKGKPFPLDFHDERTAQHDETFVAFKMHVRSGIAPDLIGIVIPDLEQVGTKSNVIRRGVTGKQGAVIGQSAVRNAAHITIPSRRRSKRMTFSHALRVSTGMKWTLRRRHSMRMLSRHSCTRRT